MFLKKHEKEELNIHDSYAKIRILYGLWMLNSEVHMAANGKRSIASEEML